MDTALPQKFPFILDMVQYTRAIVGPPPYFAMKLFFLVV